MRAPVELEGSLAVGDHLDRAVGRARRFFADGSGEVLAWAHREAQVVEAALDGITDEP